MLCFFVSRIHKKAPSLSRQQINLRNFEEDYDINPNMFSSMLTTLCILILSAIFFVSGKIRSDIVALCALVALYNPQIQISAESETKRSIFREKDKTKRSKKESAQHSKSRNKSFVMTSVSAL